MVDLETGCTMEDGIYANKVLSNDEYQALPRLSATLIKYAINDPMKAWANCSWLNPQYHDTTTDAMKTGSAYHKLFLEGREAFNGTYKTALKKEDYENLLVTVKEMQEWLTNYSIPYTSKSTKKELIALIQSQEHHPPVWDVLVANHKNQNADKEILKQNIIDDINLAYDIVDKDAIASKAISGGLPEVSMLYTLHIKDGPDTYKIKCKARYDYLKLKSIIDLKTFSNYMSHPLMRVINKSIVDRKYNVQAASYIEAWVNSVQFIADNKMHGDNFFKKYLVESAKHSKEFWFLFQETKVPNAKLVKFPDFTDWYKWGADQLRIGQQNFCRKFVEHGKNPWVMPPELETFDDDVPNWAYDT